MGWNHHSYHTLKRPRQRLAELDLHITEVAETLAKPTGQTVDGVSYTRAELTGYLATLKAEQRELEKQVGYRRGSPVMLRGRLAP